MSTPLRALLVSDVNMANFAALLRASSSPVQLEVHEAEFGAVMPTLLDARARGWDLAPDVTFLWTRPEGVLPTFADALSGRRVLPEDIDAEVDRFANAVLAATERARWTLVASWVPSFGVRGLGVMDLADPAGLRGLLLRANARLLERLRGNAKCWVLDASAWQEGATTDRKLWYAAKVPFPMPTLRAAARDLHAFLNAATGKARKLIILDLDNTMWGGVVGENGWEGVRLGGHDPVGEAFVDFQRALKALSQRGVVLALCSKNEESVAMEAIRKHPDMVLREDDFAGWRINWGDKAENVRSLLEELRLGADAAVFLDDQPAERARVAQVHPDILVPEWPADGLTSAEKLDRLACFDLLALSAEDSARAQSYAAERQRRALASTASSPEAWLAELGVKVQLSHLSATDLPRAAQLLNKTNQMNLRTRRLSEAELSTWAAAPSRSLLTCRVADRFSDFGLTGIISVEVRNGVAHVEDFLLSCRVMSRKVEETLLRAAIVEAERLGASSLVAEFAPTPRNAPMLSFMEQSGMRREAEHHYVASLQDLKAWPEGLEVSGPELG